MDTVDNKFERSISRISEITWDEEMKKDLMACYKEALEDFNSEDPPRYLCSGRVVGVRQLLFRKWEDLGYARYQLTSQDLQDQCWKLKYSNNEVTTLRKEGLRKVLEEFEKGNDVHISEIIDLKNELDNYDKGQNNYEEIKENIKGKIKLKEGTEHLDVTQCMKFLANELHIDTEEEVLAAFKVFDKNNSGTISLSEMKSIMAEQGQSLDEEELRLMEECSRAYKVEIKQGNNDIKPEAEEEIKNLKSKKGGILSITKKNKKERKKLKEIAKEKNEENDDPKDIRVDYKAFVKGIMEKINNQEKKLWENKS